jgi:hypothetical protein
LIVKCFSSIKLDIFTKSIWGIMNSRLLIHHKKLQDIPERDR